MARSSDTNNPKESGKPYNDLDVFGVSYVRLGSHMRLIRRDLGLTPEQLAERMGEDLGFATTAKNIRNYEGAYAAPSVPFVVSFAIICCLEKGNLNWRYMLCDLIENSLGDNLRNRINDTRAKWGKSSPDDAFNALWKSAGDPNFKGYDTTEVIGRNFGREIIVHNPPNPADNGGLE